MQKEKEGRITEVLESYNGLKLVRKYNKYYLRFEGGLLHSCIYDIDISDSEANDILSNREKMGEIFNEYKENINWVESAFMNNALEDYMQYRCGMSSAEIHDYICRFNSFSKLKTEFCNAIANEKFPDKDAVSISGYTAKRLNDEFNMPYFEAYQAMLRLHEAPKEELAELEVYGATNHADKIIDELKAVPKKWADDICVQDRHWDGNLQAFVITFKACEYFWVTIKYINGLLTPFIGCGSPLLAINSLETQWDDFNLKEWVGRLVEDVNLRIPEKYLIAKKYI